MKAKKHIMSYGNYIMLMKRKNFSVKCHHCGKAINRKDEYISCSKHGRRLNAFKIYCVNCAKELNII